MTAIQIRGTSGSGKTHVMKSVMVKSCDRGSEGEADLFDYWQPYYKQTRKKPLYYVNGDWAILGHYDSNCGGCDTIGSAAKIYELIQSLKPLNILAESLLLSEDVKWSSQLPDLKVLFLNTPIETCLEQIKQRRLSVGNTKPLNPKNTENRVATIERARIRLLDAGIYCRRVSVDQAIKQVLKWLEPDQKRQ